MKSNDYQRNTGLDDRFKQTKGDRLDDIIFSKNYAETISEIINFATIIYNKKLLICAYQMILGNYIKKVLLEII